MGQKSGPAKQPAEQLVKAIRRATRRQFSAEEKIRIVLSGLRGEILRWLKSGHQLR
jgi:transposase